MSQWEDYLAIITDSLSPEGAAGFAPCACHLITATLPMLAKSGEAGYMGAQMNMVSHAMYIGYMMGQRAYALAPWADGLREMGANEPE